MIKKNFFFSTKFLFFVYMFCWGESNHSQLIYIIKEKEIKNTQKKKKKKFFPPS